MGLIVTTMKNYYYFLAFVIFFIFHFMSVSADLFNLEKSSDSWKRVASDKSVRGDFVFKFHDQETTAGTVKTNNNNNNKKKKKKKIFVKLKKKKKKKKKKS